MPTYSDEQLIAYAAGELAPQESSAVAAHVKNDAHARELVNAWRAVAQLTSNDDSVEPSPAAMARAKAIFTSRKALAGSSLGAMAGSWIASVDRFIARLVYDSRIQPAAVRFADAHDRVVLTFDVEDGDVDVQATRIEGDREAWRIVGQITDKHPSAREIALVMRGNDIPAATAVSNDHGEFTVEIPPGDYDLLIRTGGGAVVLSPIELRL